MLTPVSPFTREVWVIVPCMQLLVLLQEARDRESLPTCVTCPGLLACMSPFVDIKMGCQLIGLPAHVAAEGSLIGV